MSMLPVRHDRLFPLSRLSSYPGTEVLDMVMFLPESDDMSRHVWLQCPQGKPVVAFDDTRLEPIDVHDGQPRWVDLGVTVLRPGFGQLRITGLPLAEAAESTLLVCSDKQYCPAGKSVEGVEQDLFGISRWDAGTTTLHPSSVEVGQEADYLVRYAAGPEGLPAGALVRFALPKAFSPPQAEHPDEPGYVHADGTGAAVTVVDIGDSIESHEKVDIVCRLEKGLDPFTGFELSYRNRRMIIYPTVMDDPDRPYWYSKQPPLAAAVAISQEHAPVSLAPSNGHVLEVLPGPCQRLHLFLPGRRYTGESIVVRGTFTDRFRNVAPRGALLNDIRLVLVRDDTSVDLGTPAGRFVDGYRFGIPLPELGPGVYRVEARRLESDELVARSNPLEMVHAESDRQRIYWGEIHAHSEMSDGAGQFPELYRHAREDGCLDFAAAADHACYFSDNQWQWMQDVTNSFNDPPHFVTLIGYEWAGRQGHRNVYTSRRRLKLMRGMYPPESTLDVVFDEFHNDPEVVAGPHGLMAHGHTWEHHDPTVQRFAEIYSMWGAGDSRETDLAPDWAKENPRAIPAWDLLNQGVKLGFTGGGDCHEGHAGFSCEDPEAQGTRPHTFAPRLAYRCGMTAAVMGKLDRGSLVDALRNRRTYATTGARILLEFFVGEVPMGAVGTTHRRECWGMVHAVDEVAELRIIRNGQVVQTVEPTGLDLQFDWTDTDESTDETWYVLHVIQHDGHQAWSSPVWVTA